MRGVLGGVWALVSFLLLALGTLYLVLVVILNFMKPMTGQCGKHLRIEKYFYADWVCRELSNGQE